MPPSAFEALCADVGSWIWGTVKGAFNEKASLSQIVVDAVIGMVPVVGDVTAVRDLLAVTIGLVDEPKKRDDTWQWVLLVVLLFALIPVLGGVIKGVGRLIVKAAGEAARLAGAAERAAHMAEAAKDIVAFLNRVGVGNAEKWLLKLKFADHQTAIMEKFNDLVVTLRRALEGIQRKLGNVLPGGLLQRIEGLKSGLVQLQDKAGAMIPQAVKDLDQQLRAIQHYVRSGGETTARTVEHVAASGGKAVPSYAEELRLIEEGSGALRSAKGGWVQNAARGDAQGRAAIMNVYQHEPGFPDLLQKMEFDEASRRSTFTYITTYAGKIKNRTLHPGENVYRVFGPKGVTHRFDVGNSYPTSAGAKFWGVGDVPKTAKEWRERGAVLDEWNHDSYMVVGRVEEAKKVKACTGRIAEQSGKDIPGQYLPGDWQQAMFEMSEDGIKQLRAAGEQAISSGTMQTLTVDGIAFTVVPTGWKDANGVWGYLRMPGPGTVQTVRLGARERATKDERGNTSAGQAHAH